MSDLAVKEKAERKSELLKRFRENEGADFTDRELLELILLICSSSNNIDDLTNKIFVKFNSLSEIINAQLADIMTIDKVNETTAVALKIIAACGKKAAEECIYSTKESVVKNWDKFLDFCRQSMAYEKVEEFRIFMLDEKLHCFTNIIASRGTVNQTTAYPREVIRLAMQRNAKNLILAHNHPSGDSKPSDDDKLLTEAICDVANSAGIRIFDHLIITEGQIFSFRSNGYIKDL